MNNYMLSPFPDQILPEILDGEISLKEVLDLTRSENETT